MSYNYAEQRPRLFTEEGVNLFICMHLLMEAGAVRMDGFTGDIWDMLACADRLVEIGELREIVQERCTGQHRVFVKGV